MAQPSPFVRKYSFTNAFAASPTMVFPGASLDLELNSAKATLDQILQNLKLLQNDDGTVLNGSIGKNQLSPSLQTGFNPPTVWSPGAAYAASPASTVFENNKFYSCLVSHTSSSSFAADLAAGYWVIIADLSTIPLQTANNIAITPAGGIVTTNVQSAAYGLDTRITANTASLAGFVAANVTDSTTTGRALMTTASTDAALATLNSWTTGDAKLTFKTVADTGWMLADDSTIGPASSGATHTGTTYQALFNLFFANMADADVPLLTSSGGSTTRSAQGTAAAAWANLCRMTIPPTLGRALGVAGAGATLTSRALGAKVGEETHALTSGENGPHTHGITDPGHTHTPAAGTLVNTGSTNNGIFAAGANANGTTLTTNTTGITVNSSGSGTGHNNMQPTSFLNLMIKL